MKDAVQPGIRLNRFSRANADLILSWRNAPQVRANSVNDAEIALADHLSFVDGLAAQGTRHFFLVLLDGRPEAVLNVNVDGTTALWGCYLSPQSSIRPGLFPMLVAISGRLAFGSLGCTALESEVLTANTAPQRLNAFLGVPAARTRRHTRPSGEPVEIIQYRIDHEKWPSIRAKINSIVTRAQRDLLADFDAGPNAFIS